MYKLDLVSPMGYNGRTSRWSSRDRPVIPFPLLPPFLVLRTERDGNIHFSFLLLRDETHVSALLPPGIGANLKPSVYINYARTMMMMFSLTNVRLGATVVARSENGPDTATTTHVIHTCAEIPSTALLVVSLN